MKKIKMLALMLLVFSFVIVTACSESGTTKEPEAPKVAEQPDTKQETPDTTEQPAPEPEPTIDMKGQSIKILTWAKAPTDETQEGALQLERQKEVEKKYNVKIEWVVVPWGTSMDMVTAAGLSGEPVADFALFTIYQAIPLINEGLLRPIDEYFDFDDG